MEPLGAAAAIVGAAGGMNTLKTATKDTRSAFRRLRIAGLYDPKWLDLGLTEAGTESRFTADEAADVSDFLASSRMKPMLSFMAVAMMYPAGTHRTEMLQTARGLFDAEVTRWNLTSRFKWQKAGQALWERLEELYRGTLPSVADTLGLADEVEAFSAFLANPIAVVDQDDTIEAEFAKNIIALASDPAALTATSRLSGDLAARIRSSGHEPIINHTEVHRPVEFRSQYVNRDFSDIESGLVEESAGMISSGTPFRVVILGPPGAGKTTFVNYLVAGLADPALRNPSIPSVVIRCRDYARGGWSDSIPAYAAQKLQAELSKTISAVQLDHLLLTGGIAVVFDGLDEITDKTRRGDMVKRIHTFTSQYPAASVLVTSREVGYQHAPLNRRLFRGVRLQEFSQEQTQEYCRKWFGGNDRPDLVEAFMADSATVEDLRANPLLLSLLCMLYKESGAIPSNRRGIYHQCASLLFHKWDAHRQINQHEAMPDYGDRLMQEIARWFYNSTIAQEGVEERQVVKVISTYMETNIGFQPGKAESSARDFLSFCADRAWLLGDIGTSSGGERLFAFTHRTFYEFFTAEAFARQASSVEDAASKMLEAYRRDATSVVPELLIQSYDFMKERGATDIFVHLCPFAPPLLLLRLMDGAILAPFARSRGFGRITEDLQSMDGEAFTALLSINTLAREHFVEEYLLHPDRSSVRRTFLHGWAGLQLSSFGQVFARIWAPVLDRIIAAFPAEIAAISDPATVNWLVGTGRKAAELQNAWDYISCRSIFGPVPGYVWWCIDAVLRQGLAVEEDADHDRIMSEVHARLTDQRPVHPRYVGQFLEALEPIRLDQHAWETKSPLSANERVLRDILAVLVLASIERRPDYTALLEAVSGCWSAGLAPAVALRESRAARQNTPVSGTLRRDAAAAKSALPACARAWADGRLDFLDWETSSEGESRPAGAGISRPQPVRIRPSGVRRRGI